MIRTGFEIDKVWHKSLLLESGELGAVVAGIMMSEFNDLLNNAPQRSGSYVASFRIAVDGMCDGPTKIPLERGAQNWHYMGAEEAIGMARASTSGVRGMALSMSSGMSAPVISLVNDTPYAEDAESQPGRDPGSGWDGDPGNPGSEYHVASFIAEVSAKFGQRIYVGKATWNMYRDYDL